MLELLLLVGCGTSEPVVEEAPQEAAERKGAEARIVTIGPAITEIALALAPEKVVGIDAASATLNPSLPSVGHARQVAAEGVLSLEPTRVLTDASAGPPPVLEQLKAAVPVETLTHERSVAGVEALVEQVAKAVDADPKQVQERFRSSCEALPKGEPRGSALFVYARGAGTMNVSGTGTAADAMLALAGLENAVTGYEGYKPLTPEAAIAADPDYVLFTTHGLEGIGGIEGVRGTPGLAGLPAVSEGRIAAIDDFDLLAFGLGTCTGARALAEATGG